MIRIECRRQYYFPVLVAVLLATVLALAGCKSPEKAKAEHVSRGEALLKAEKYQEAVIEFRNAIQIDDKLAAAHWGLARAYQGLQRGQDAFDELDRTVQLDPNNLDACVTLGNVYLGNLNVSQEFLGKAEQLAKSILQKDANHVEGHILMSGVLFAQNHRDLALNELNRAIELKPTRVESYLALSRYYIVTNDRGKAEDTLKRAIALNSSSALAHTEYGKFLVQMDRKADGEAEFLKAVQVDPTDRNSRFVLASYYLVTKQLDKAEESYKVLADLNKDRPEGRAMLADYYSVVNRYDEAIRIYQDLVAKSPDYTQGRYRLGEIMLMNGDSKGTLAQVDALLKVDQHDRQALLLRARVRSQAGQPGDLKAAIEDLKEVLKQEPTSRLGLYFMAQAQFSLGLYDQARTFVGELQKNYPDYLPAKLMQTQISLTTGDSKSALQQSSELLDRLSKASPDRDTSPQMLAGLTSRAYVSRGSAEVQTGDLAGARRDFIAAREVAPKETESYTNLAVVSLLEQKPDEAIGFYENALSIDPVNFTALNGLVGIYTRQKQPEKAQARLDQVIASYPNNASLHFLKAQIYGAQQNAGGAESELRKTLELDPNYSAARSSLGALFINSKQPDRALAEYKQIIDRQQDSAATYVLIGMLEDGRKNYDAAVDNYRKALEQDQNSAIAANNLAWLYATQGKGNLDEAVRLAQGIVQKNPTVAGFADTLGWVYYKKGLFGAATEQLQKAVSLDEAAAQKSNESPNASYHYHLGAALASKGDKAGAKRELETSVRMGEKAPFAEIDEARKALSVL
jgi:tetratricopeptide (TPR) repeat protein